MSRSLEHMGICFPEDGEVLTERIVASLRNGRYESQEARAVSRFVEPGDRVLELGAGLGFISSFLYKSLGVREILCVEANPGLCAYIAEVHRANGATDIAIRNGIAVGDTVAQSELPFYVRDPFWGSSLDAHGDYVDCVKVPAYPLTGLVRDFGAHVMIVDIEGGERDLFEDASLNGVTKIFLELHTRKIGRVGVKTCFDALSAQGFAYDQQVSSGGSVLFRRIPDWRLRQSARARSGRT